MKTNAELKKALRDLHSELALASMKAEKQSDKLWLAAAGSDVFAAWSKVRLTTDAAKQEKAA